MFCPCNVGKLLGLQAMGSIDERKVGSTLEMVLMIRFLLYCSLSCDRSHSNDILDGTRFRHSFVITSQLTSLPQTWSVSSEKNSNQGSVQGLQETRAWGTTTTKMSRLMDGRKR